MFLHFSTSIKLTSKSAVLDGDKRFNVLSHLSTMLHKFTQNSCKLVGKSLIKNFSLVNYFAKVVAN